MFFNIDLVTFITQLLHFSECGGKLTLKAFGLRLDVGPYKKLDKGIKTLKTNKTR